MVGESHTTVGSKRRPNRSVATNFVVLGLVSWVTGLICLSVLFAIVSIPLSFAGIEIWGPAFWITVALWTAAAPLMFLRPVEELTGRLSGLRPPTRGEAQILDPIWQEVTARAGLQQADFILRVSSEPTLNATARGYRTVAVTRGTLTTVTDPDQLGGILAHELGHHLDLAVIPGALSFWYRSPVRVLMRIGFAALAVGGILAVLSRRTLIFTIPLLLMGLLFGLIIGVPLLIANVVWAATSRSNEYSADRRAAELGFGSGLISVLSSFPDTGEKSVTRRMFATHPQPSRRIAALEDLTGFVAPVQPASPGVTSSRLEDHTPFAEPAPHESARAGSFRVIRRGQEGAPP